MWKEVWKIPQTMAKSGKPCLSDKNSGVIVAFYITMHSTLSSHGCLKRAKCSLMWSYLPLASLFWHSHWSSHFFSITSTEVWIIHVIVEMVISYHLRYLSLLTNFSSPHLSFHYIVHLESWIQLLFFLCTCPIMILNLNKFMI